MGADIPGGRDPDEMVNHPLLGKRVTVTLARAGDIGSEGDIFYVVEPEPLTEDITTTGTLVRLDVWGEAVIDTPEGRVSCWPALEIVEATE